MQVLEKALTAELEGLQKIHVAVAKQITRLQVCAQSIHKFALQKLEQPDLEAAYN